MLNRTQLLDHAKTCNATDIHICAGAPDTTGFRDPPGQYGDTDGSPSKNYYDRTPQQQGC